MSRGVHLAPSSSFSSAPPLPRPPLFPYTTLFRSPREDLLPPDRPAVDKDRSSLPESLYGRSGAFQGRGATPDRKSTRLNSSHVSSSYAVFCLKKKTQRLVGRGSNGRQPMFVRHAS